MEDIKKEEEKVKLRLFGIPLILPFLKQYGKRIILMIFLGVVSSSIDSVFPLFNR